MSPRDEFATPPIYSENCINNERCRGTLSVEWKHHIIYSRIQDTLSGLIFAWRYFREFREFDLFRENKTRKNTLNP